jgi:hypothetical protein
MREAFMQQQKKNVCSPVTNSWVCSPLIVFRIIPTSCIIVSFVLKSESGPDSKNCEGTTNSQICSSDAHNFFPQQWPAPRGLMAWSPFSHACVLPPAWMPRGQRRPLFRLPSTSASSPKQARLLRHKLTPNHAVRILQWWRGMNKLKGSIDARSGHISKHLLVRGPQMSLADLWIVRSIRSIEATGQTGLHEVVAKIFVLF